MFPLTFLPALNISFCSVFFNIGYGCYLTPLPFSDIALYSSLPLLSLVHFLVPPMSLTRLWHLCKDRYIRGLCMPAIPVEQMCLIAWLRCIFKRRVLLRFP